MLRYRMELDSASLSRATEARRLPVCGRWQPPSRQAPSGADKWGDSAHRRIGGDSMRTVWIAVLLAAMATAAHADLVWHTWAVSAGGNGHAYAALTTPDTWGNHNATAQDLGGYLVTLTSSAENEWALSQFTDTRTYWMGLYQPPGTPEPDGGWLWVTGEPYDWRNWKDGEPNNHVYVAGAWRDEDHVSVGGVEHTWIDRNGEYSDFYAIVEHSNPEEIPEPGTLLLMLSGVAAVGLKRRLKS
ncbi:MAG: PEP-CTERM sorting domain-containing protein [Armatimonadia bacterium]|nr:PEP-CTERM sorting domain-containing protein [Armatimonadia bacterium]